ncbi:MAG: S1 RNA-binding domain-containing protein [Clostridia bacterium]|nr:S1 RNA-binding domain-containing protein [Clostridia bacterium]
MLLEAGKIVEGKITGIMPFGAFMDLGEGKNGLVHISEIAPEYVKDINDHVKVGDTVKAKILTIEANGKISLSIKQAILEERKQQKKASAQSSRPPFVGSWEKKASSAPMTFEDMMNRFKQDSDEKMQDIKRNVESKRGSSYRRSSGSF